MAKSTEHQERVPARPEARTRAPQPDGGRGSRRGKGAASVLALHGSAGNHRLARYVWRRPAFAGRRLQRFNEATGQPDAGELRLVGAALTARARSGVAFQQLQQWAGANLPPQTAARYAAKVVAVAAQHVAQGQPLALHGALSGWGHGAIPALTANVPAITPGAPATEAVWQHAQTLQPNYVPSLRPDFDPPLRPGYCYASHAEKQATIAWPGDSIGVHEPMCGDCQRFFRATAAQRGQVIAVADSAHVHLFLQNGHQWRRPVAGGPFVRLHPAPAPAGGGAQPPPAAAPPPPVAPPAPALAAPAPAHGHAPGNG